MKNRKIPAKDPLAAEVTKLSRSFAERAVDPSYMDRAESREAYGAYYGEVSRSKGESLGYEILRRGAPSLFLKSPLRMLDLGSGTGEFALGVADALLSLPSLSLSLHLVDRSREALSDAAREGEHSRLSLTFSQAVLPDARPFLPGSFDIVTMANCLAENENSVEEFADLLQEISTFLTPGGLLLLVEPADRRASRTLLTLGDSLLSRHSPLSLLAPCPGGRTSSCPALEDPGDWCHEDRPADFSEFLLKTARSVGHVKDALKMTYLLFGREGTPAPPSLRLVSPLHKEKGLFFGDFCDGKTWWRIRLLTRNRGDLTRSFTRLHRGETLSESSPLSLAIAPPVDGRGSIDWPKDRQVVRLAHPDGRPFDSDDET